MYAVKPLYPNIAVRDLPNIMYEPKGYGFESTSGGASTPQTKTPTLSSEQPLKRLEIINSKLDGLICEVCRLIQNNLARLDLANDGKPQRSSESSSCSCETSLQNNCKSEDEKNDELLVELSRQQQSQLRRLNKLQAKLDELCEDLRLDHLISSTQALSIERKDNKTTSNNKQTGSQQAKSTLKSFEKDPQFNELLKNMSRLSIKKNKQLIEDLVVQLDPNEIPYSVFVQFQQLASNFRCFVQVHRHSSILGPAYESQNVKIQNLINLFTGLNYHLTDARSNYDFVLTVIFKNLNKQQPVLATSALGQTAVHGESNILRYLAKLSNDANGKDKDAYSSKLDLNKRILIDEQIDRCTNELLLTGQKDGYIKGINGALAKSKFLTSGDKPSLADVYVWSVLKQSNVNTANLKTVNEWADRVEKAYPLLGLLKQI